MLKETAKAFLPCFIHGKVVKGFGRGSKQLGCPTANFADHVVSQLPQNFPCGVYYGWANVDNGTVHKMVMSVGWNPQFHNTRKTMEAHILHKYNDDFYGSALKVIVLGYLRQMTSFSNLDELKEAIKKDIDESVSALEVDINGSYQNHSFFTAGGEIPIVSSSNFAVLNHHLPSEKHSSLNGFHHSNNRQNS